MNAYNKVGGMKRSHKYKIHIKVEYKHIDISISLFENPGGVFLFCCKKNSVPYIF